MDWLKLRENPFVIRAVHHLIVFICSASQVLGLKVPHLTSLKSTEEADFIFPLQ